MARSPDDLDRPNRGDARDLGASARAMARVSRLSGRAGVESGVDIELDIEGRRTPEETSAAPLEPSSQPFAAAHAHPRY
jgi:hypothetical protein